MASPISFKKETNPNVFKTLSFRMNEKEKEYIDEIINIIKKEINCNNKDALIFMATAFNLLSTICLTHDLLDLIIQSQNVKLIREHFSINKLNKNYCIYLIKINDVYLCSEDIHFEKDKIEFKPLKNYPIECETCENKRCVEK